MRGRAQPQLLGEEAKVLHARRSTSHLASALEDAHAGYTITTIQVQQLFDDFVVDPHKMTCLAGSPQLQEELKRPILHQLSRKLMQGSQIANMNKVFKL